jgi:hypothetical protein
MYLLYTDINDVFKHSSMFRSIGHFQGHSLMLPDTQDHYLHCQKLHNYAKEISTKSKISCYDYKQGNI